VITEIEIEGFKSLEKVRLKLGKLNLFVGANASGKSNFFDVLRVLQGIGYGFTINEVFDGRPKTGGSESWEPIRGGWAWAQSYSYNSHSDKKNIRLRVGLDLGSLGLGRYGLTLSSKHVSVRSESLAVGGSLIFSAREIENEALDLINVKAGELRVSLESRGPILSPMLEEVAADRFRRDSVKACLRKLGGFQRIEPSLAELRDYTRASTRITRMGEQGENFAGLVQSIISDEKLRIAYTAWLRELTPMDLEDVNILEGALGEPLFAVKEGGKIVPAPVLSDGTLRFAALAAAFFQPDMPDIITIEEIENGIHPTRLRLLVELLKSQSAESGPQVFATTHSPVVLAWLDESDYETTFFCKRDEETGASVIKPLSEIPRLVDLAKKRSLGELFTQGWMEIAP
jgi:energy-coupling factor transporter ATP-binding protein EcfA2